LYVIIAGVLWWGEAAHCGVEHFVLSQNIETIEQRRDRERIIRMEDKKQDNDRGGTVR